LGAIVILGLLQFYYICYKDVNKFIIESITLSFISFYIYVLSIITLVNIFEFRLRYKWKKLLYIVTDCIRYFTLSVILISWIYTVILDIILTLHKQGYIKGGSIIESCDIRQFILYTIIISFLTIIYYIFDNKMFKNLRNKFREFAKSELIIKYRQIFPTIIVGT
jgi:hypothetical protein